MTDPTPALTDAEQADVSAAIRDYLTANEYPWPSLTATALTHHLAPLLARVVREHTASQVAAAKAEALREAADDLSLRLSGHSGISIRRLRDRAEGLDADPAPDADATALARVRALVDEWEGATCITDGAPCSFHRYAADYAGDLRNALAGDEQDGEGR